MSRDGCVALLAVPWDCLWFVIVLFPDHTHLLFFIALPPLILTSLNRRNTKICTVLEIRHFCFVSEKNKFDCIKDSIPTVHRQQTSLTETTI